MSESLPTPAKGAKIKAALGRAPSWLGTLVVLAVLLAIVGAARPRFLSPANLALIVHSWSFKGVIAIGMAFVIMAGGIDLSVGAMLALAAVTGMWVMNAIVDAPAILAAAERVAPGDLGALHGAVQTAVAQAATAIGLAGNGPLGLLIGALVMLAVGLAAGWLNGLLITRGGVPAFVATLGGLVAFRSLGVTLTDSSNITAAGDGLFESIASGGLTLGGGLVIRTPIFIFLAVALVGHVLLTWTRFGRHVLAVGSNEQAARYSGLRPGKVRRGTYLLLGALTAGAALLAASRQGTVGAGEIGMMWELDVIAAVIIGGVRMSGGAGSIIGVVLGVLILSTIDNMLVLLRIPTDLQKFVMGVVIVVAVLLQRGRRPDQN